MTRERFNRIAPYVSVIALAVSVCALALSNLVDRKVHAQDIVYGTPQSQPSRTKANVAYIHIAIVPSPRIEVGIVDEDNIIRPFNYPAQGVTALDTDAEVLTLISSFNVANLSTAHTTPVTTGSLKYRVADILCRDFPTKMPSGSCTVQ